MSTVPSPIPADNPGTPTPDPPFVARRPGPQPVNRVAGTFDAQLASVFGPRPKPSRPDAELAELRRQVLFLLGAVYGKRRGGGYA